MRRSVRKWGQRTPSCLASAGPQRGQRRRGSAAGRHGRLRSPPGVRRAASRTHRPRRRLRRLRRGWCGRGRERAELRSLGRMARYGRSRLQDGERQRVRHGGLRAGRAAGTDVDRRPVHRYGDRRSRRESRPAGRTLRAPDRSPRTRVMRTALRCRVVRRSGGSSATHRAASSANSAALSLGAGSLSASPFTYSGALARIASCTRSHGRHQQPPRDGRRREQAHGPDVLLPGHVGAEPHRVRDHVRRSVRRDPHRRERELVHRSGGREHGHRPVVPGGRLGVLDRQRPPERADCGLQYMQQYVPTAVSGAKGYVKGTS